jgi:hemerythrin
LINDELLHDKYDKIVDILGELKEYTVKHFSDEEAYMEEIHYSGLDAQKLAHTAFVDKLNEIDLDQVDDNQQEYLNGLIDFLLGWLVNHILKMDKKIS